MGKESMVEIPPDSENHYRYEYVDGKTLYRGPVGDSPELSEEEFLVAVHRGIADVKLTRIRDRIDREFLTDSIMVPVKTTKNPDKTVWINVKDADLEGYFASAWAQVSYDNERGNYIEINDINDIIEKEVIIFEDDRWVRVNP